MHRAGGRFTGYLNGRSTSVLRPTDGLCAGAAEPTLPPDDMAMSTRTVRAFEAGAASSIRMRRAGRDISLHFVVNVFSSALLPPSSPLDGS